VLCVVDINVSKVAPLVSRCSQVMGPNGSGGATPGRARSNDLAGRSTALANDLAKDIGSTLLNAFLR